MPSPMASRAISSVRTIETQNGVRTAVYTFPDTAFRDLVALDDTRDWLRVALSQSHRSSVGHGLHHRSRVGDRSDRQRRGRCPSNGC